MHYNLNISGFYLCTFSSAENGVFSLCENTDNQCCFNCAKTTAFTGKERDSETGFSYFGARYYDSDLSGLFLSVDPMSDKYPSLSPYAYCAWNPVKYIDPNGDSLFAFDIYSQNDIKSVAGKYGSRISFNEKGVASIDYSGLSDKERAKMDRDNGVSLLSDIISSDKRILYEASDVAMYRDENGNKQAFYLNNKGIVNASFGGMDSKGKHTDLPKEGYDGQVVVALSGQWKGRRGFVSRIEIVSHELAENYARTVLNYNYSGSNSAHLYANTRMRNLEFVYDYRPFVVTQKMINYYEALVSTKN